MKSINLSADTFKKTLELSGSIPEPAIRSGDTGQQKQYFTSYQLIKTWMYNIRLQAPNVRLIIGIPVVRKKGKVGWSMYGHVIAEFSRMDRFSKLWVTSRGRKMSPRYSQVMMVSVYSSLTAAN